MPNTYSCFTTMVVWCTAAYICIQKLCCSILWYVAGLLHLLYLFKVLWPSIVPHHSNGGHQCYNGGCIQEVRLGIPAQIWQSMRLAALLAWLSHMFICLFIGDQPPTLLFTHHWKSNQGSLFIGRHDCCFSTFFITIPNSHCVERILSWLAPTALARQEHCSL